MMQRCRSSSGQNRINEDQQIQWPTVAGLRASAALRQRPGDSSLGMLLPMQKLPSRAGVCILRVEVESWGLLITMTVNRDIASGAAEPLIRFSDTDEATAAVAAFLQSFTADNQP